MPPVLRLRALLRLLYDPSSHSVPIFGTPRHPNHRPSGTSALDTENEMYSLTSRLHLLLMPKSRSNKFEHDFWLKAVLTRVSETDSCVAVLSRTSAILPPNRLARLAHSANGKQGFADSLRRAVGGSIRREQGVKMHFHPLQPPSNHCATVVWLFSRCGKLASIGNAAPSLSAIKLLILRFLHLVQKCLFQTSRLPRLNVF